MSAWTTSSGFVLGDRNMDPLRVPISPEERKAPLDARRNAKMSTSAHAYVRGSTDSFYGWLSARSKKLPHGPAIWVGGDCHVGNLGPLANMDGSVRIELRDLDQTVIGCPAHDVIRLALSMAMAVRASGLPGAVAAHLVEAISRGYERVLEVRASRRNAALPPPPPSLAKVLKAASKRSSQQLFIERLGRNERVIPIGKRYWPLTDDEHAAVSSFFETEPARKLVTALTGRSDDAPVRLVDAAYWIKGCSSLGLWRCAAVVQVGSSADAKSGGSLALMDLKEARPGLAPKAPRARMPKHQGERVVSGARRLAPSLGDRMLSATVAGKEIFVRELLPQDLKFDLDALGDKEAIAIGGYLASVVAMAHSQQMEPAECADYLVEFRRTPVNRLAAPAWLWASVVDLVALHEGAYLEHCREHALRAPIAELAETPDLVSHAVTGD